MANGHVAGIRDADGTRGDGGEASATGRPKTVAVTELCCSEHQEAASQCTQVRSQANPHAKGVDRYHKGKDNIAPQDEQNMRLLR